MSGLLKIEFPTPSCAKAASASQQDGDGGIRMEVLERSSLGLGVESGGVAIEPGLSGVTARVLGLVWGEVVPVHPRVLRVVALTLARMANGSLVNSQGMPLAVHFWHGCCRLHFTLALAHASQDLRRDRLS